MTVLWMRVESGSPQARRSEVEAATMTSRRESEGGESVREERGVCV